MDLKQLKTDIAAQLKTILAARGVPDVPSVDALANMLEYPPDPSMGDLAFPCFRLSKLLRQAPPAIAQSLQNEMTVPGISHIETVGGYLNFFVDERALTAQTLSEIFEKGSRYGGSDIGRGKTIVFDYSSPNVAKPFHIGHLGTTVIGHSLKMLHAFFGYNCVGINHLGDWGTQFGKLVVAYRKWGDKARIEENGIDELVALYVRFHKEAETQPQLEDEARQTFHDLENGDTACRALWKWFIDISIHEYEKTYRQLGITFDSYAGESFYVDKVPAVINELKEKNLLKVDDGATIVDLSEYNLPPCIILKSDGSTIYATRDIAAVLYRKKTYDFDKCIYVTSAGQSVHFAQLFKVIELMGYPWAKDLVHVPYGTVSINGTKLATRTGNVVLLKDLFHEAIDKVRAIIEEKNPALENKDKVAEEVGVGAIVFYYLSNNRNRDINFMMEDALSFEGNTGPYAQYTYARTCSVLSKSGMDIGGNVSLPDTLRTEEFALIKILGLFGEKTQQALAEYEPAVITRYILDVCAAFNRFYHDCQILSAQDQTTRAFRVSLTAATKTVLGNAFDLICMKKPEKI